MRQLFEYQSSLFTDYLFDEVNDLNRGDALDQVNYIDIAVEKLGVNDELDNEVRH